RLGNPLLCDGLVRNASAKGGASHRTPAHALERALGQTDQSHAMVDAPGTEAPLRDVEAAALAEQHIGGRDLDVVEKDFGVAVRRLVIAKTGSIRLMTTPGWGNGTNIIDCRW